MTVSTEYEEHKHAADRLAAPLVLEEHDCEGYARSFCAGSRVGARDERGMVFKGAMVLSVEQNYTWQSSLRAKARF